MMMILILAAMAALSALCFCLGWYYGHCIGYQEGRSDMNKQWRSMIHEKLPLLSLVHNERPAEKPQPQPEALPGAEAA